MGYRGSDSDFLWDDKYLSKFNDSFLLPQGFAIVFASMMIYIAFKCSTISINTVKRNISASNQFIDNHRLTYKSDVSCFLLHFFLISFENNIE